MQLDDEEDDTIKDVAQGAVHTPGRLDHSAKLHHVGPHTVRCKVGVQPDIWTWDKESTGDHIYTRISSSPGNTNLQLCHSSQTEPSMEADAQELGGGHYEDIGDISRANTEIQKKEGIAFLL